MPGIFLTAAWRNLIMANYELPAAVLQPYLPAHTVLDSFEGKHFVSLVGFLFDDVKIKGFSIPFHTRFPEVNLRMYVKHVSPNGSVRRGVVFISEIVPKKAIALVANTIYNEKYTATAMRHAFTEQGDERLFSYTWQWKGKENRIEARVGKKPAPMQPNSEEAFIFEHYYGFSKVNETITNQYEVAHPSWQTFPVRDHHIDCQFEKFYGQPFAFLDHAQPASVFVAEGSEVLIRSKTVLR